VARTCLGHCEPLGWPLRWRRLGSAGFASQSRRERSRHSPPVRCATSAPAVQRSDGCWGPGRRTHSLKRRSAQRTHRRRRVTRPGKRMRRARGLSARSKPLRWASQQRRLHKLTLGPTAPQSCWRLHPTAADLVNLGIHEVMLHVISSALARSTPRCSRPLHAARGGTFRRGGSRRRRLESPSPAEALLSPVGLASGETSRGGGDAADAAGLTDHLVREPPLVVVPRHDLDERAVDDRGELQIDDRGPRIADDVGGHQGIF
jgi:hypothetical protein